MKSISDLLKIMGQDIRLPSPSSFKGLVVAIERKAVASAIWAGVVCLSPYSAAAQHSGAGTSAVHDLAVYFTSNGWFECARRANQVAYFLGGSTPGQVFVVNKPSGSSGLVGVTLLVPTGDDHAIGEMMFALGAQDCPASYRIESKLDTNCVERSTSEEGLEFVELDSSGHYIARLAKGAVVRLSPTPTGCSRVQTEIITGAG